MEDEYLTDQQQADRFRIWIRENGPYLIAGVVLGLGGLFGWNQWKNYQERQAEAASALYDDLRKSVGSRRLDDALATLTELEGAHGGSPYVDQGRLIMARVYIDGSDPDKAATYLKEVVDSASAPEIRNIARVRLARLLTFQEKYDDALKVLTNPGSESFGPLFHDVRGDVYVAMGKSAEARSEYEQALNGATAAPVIDRPYVQAKLDQLGGPSAGLAAAAAAAAAQPAASPAPGAAAPAAPGVSPASPVDAKPQ